MKMWIARDKDGTLWLFTHKPHRCRMVGWDMNSWDSPDECEEGDVINCMEINPSLYPEVTWETEPLELELVNKN